MPANFVLFVTLLVLWAGMHSLTAALFFKRWFKEHFGERFFYGWYRLVYNLVSAATIVPVLYVGVLALPPDVFWSIRAPIRIIFRIIQVAGVIGLSVSLYQTDLWDFAGIRQAVHYLKRDGDSDLQPRMVTGGTYAFVRHPLYFFSLLVIWFNPVMSWRMLIFNLAATIYFAIGSIHEEKRLIRKFGQPYREYQNKVPWLLPRWRPMKKRP